MFCLQEKMDIQVDTSKETHVTQAVRLGNVLSVLNITVTKGKDTRKSYAGDQ